MNCIVITAIIVAFCLAWFVFSAFFYAIIYCSQNDFTVNEVSIISTIFGLFANIFISIFGCLTYKVVEDRKMRLDEKNEYSPLKSKSCELE